MACLRSLLSFFHPTLKMKRLISLAVAAFIILGCATGARAEFRYGPTGGVTFCHPRFKQVLFPTQDQVGGSLGVIGENIFPGIGIGVSIGLEYQLRRAGLDLGDREMWASQGYGHVDMNIHYVAIPLHLRWKWTRLNGLEDFVAPFIYGGPTFGIMAGHTRLRPFSFSGGDLNLDCGLGVEVLRHLQISGGYSFGMTYSYEAKILSNFSTRTSFWSVKLAYLF